MKNEQNGCNCEIEESAKARCCCGERLLPSDRLACEVEFFLLSTIQTTGMEVYMDDEIGAKQQH